MIVNSIAFEGFVLDLESGVLSRGTTLIDLRPKLYALLVYLIGSPGRLIPKEELMTALWGTTHVTDGSLNRAVTALRSALNDDSPQNRIIETVPRRGYRFTAGITTTATKGAARHPSSFLMLYADRRLRLFEGENIVGRTPECDVQIASRSVSRRHARIVVGENVTIEDLGSTNGTFLRGVRITAPEQIHSREDIGIGTEKIWLVSDSAQHGSTDRVEISEFYPNSVRTPASRSGEHRFLDNKGKRDAKKP